MRQRLGRRAATRAANLLAEEQQDNDGQRDQPVKWGELSHGGDLAPTEGWSDGGQNCFHDMRVVGDTELIRNG